MKWHERTIWILVVAFILVGMVTTSVSQASTILKLVFPVQVELYYDEVNFPVAHVIEKFTDRNGVSTFIDRGTAEPRSREDMTLLFPGTIKEEWTSEQEEQGTAWQFRSDRDFTLTLPYGKADSDRGLLTAGMSITTRGITWRPLSPFFSGNPQTTSAPSPAPQANPSDLNRPMLGSELARIMGWNLIDPQPVEVTKFGGAVVEVPIGATLPSEWTFAGSPGKNFSDGGVFSIYPPMKFRGALGVQS